MNAPDSVPEPPLDSRLLRLDPRDNVLTLTASLPAGTALELDGRTVILDEALGLGHKLAACDLEPGAKVLKYGVPIGSASVRIRAGEHVHTHNLRSDYLPTYLHRTQEAFFREHR